MLDTTPDRRRDLITELEEAIAAAEIDAARHHLEAVGTGRDGRSSTTSGPGIAWSRSGS